MERRRARRARLPWKELEREAARQGCSPADIFFDLAGHRHEALLGTEGRPSDPGRHPS
jgi:hypothetical protein